MAKPLPIADLEDILAATTPLWESARHQRIFLTGGTGFFGCWLVESFLHIERALSLNARLTVLTRDPAAFLRKLPHLRDQPALTLIAGDVRTFAFPAEPHRYILHAATEASAKQMAESPDEMHTTIVAGTQRVLAFATATGAARLLITSSGAVYGTQPATIPHMPEEASGDLSQFGEANVYGEGKRIAERLTLAAASPALEVAIARGFAFLGPHLPLDAHFAAGNFLRDALAGNPIRIASDGAAVRSYLYAADLTTWLWTMLFRAAPSSAYNLGSEDAINIRDLAHLTRDVVNPAIAVEVAQPLDPARPPHTYVPSTARARTELGLHQRVPLADAIRRTAAWHQLK
jgi:nucleoside-diphosphate-sugar epimerase